MIFCRKKKELQEGQKKVYFSIPLQDIAPVRSPRIPQELPETCPHGLRPRTTASAFRGLPLRGAGRLPRRQHCCCYNYYYYCLLCSCCCSRHYPSLRRCHWGYSLRRCCLHDGRSPREACLQSAVVVLKMKSIERRGQRMGAVKTSEYK